MIINTCFLTDDGYAMPTCVAITSMLQNKNKDSRYAVYILSMNVSEAHTKKILELKRDDFDIKIIPLDNKYESFSMRGVSASPTAMFKFSIPEILKDLDKIIYLDGDILINEDLSDLYRYDIGDNYIGAVKDINGAQKRHFEAFVKKKIFYFNSGVMLMNLKKLRDDNIAQKLIDYRLNGYNELMDQDALNYVLKNKAAELPFKYNTQTMMTLINKSVDKLKKIVKIENDCKSYEEVAEHSAILHYSMKAKPWKKANGFLFDKWRNYYLDSPYGREQLSFSDAAPKNNGNTIINKYKALKKNIRRYKFMKTFAGECGVERVNEK